MKANIKSVLNISLFVCIALFFLWLAYRNTDLGEIKLILEKGVSYNWIFLSAFLSLLSVIPRTLRWQLLLEPVEKKPSFWNTFFAVNMGYFANLALPRVGELSRCGVLAKYEKLHFTKSVGTVVTERIVDMLTMVVLCVLIFLLEIQVFNQFFDNYSISFSSKPMLFVFLSGLLVLGLLGLFIVRKYFWQNKWISRIKDVVHSLWLGIKSIKKVQHKKSFILYSVLVWVCYYFALFSCMSAFNFFDNITASQALFVFVAGTFSMILPAPGGIGPWHTFTIQALVLYGIGNTEAGAFALLANGTSTLIIILAGFVSIILLPIYNKGKI